MSLLATIKSATSAAFEAAGDIKVSAKFIQITGTVYDPATGGTTETTVEHPDIKGFLGGIEEREIMAGIAQLSDKAFTCQAGDIDFDLTVIDRVEIDEKTYEIINYKQDGARVTYRVFLRA